MRKINLTLLLTFFISFSCFCQETAYFTMYFNSKVQEKTPYIRRYEKSVNQISIEDFKNGKLELSGTIVGLIDIKDADEFLDYIRSLGQVEIPRKVTTFFRGKLTTKS